MASKIDPKQLEALLQDRSLTLGEIGRRLGVSRERIRQLQTKHHPDLKRPKGPIAKIDYSEYDDLFLSASVSDAEIAKKLSISKDYARVLRKKTEIRHNVFGLGSRKYIKTRINAILREAGSAWCWHCLQVKDLSEFMPASKEDFGLPCRTCNTERCRKYLAKNPQHRERVAEYQEQHRDQIRHYQKQWRQKRITSAREVAMFKEIEQVSPEMAERVRAGELSAREAAIKLRLKKGWVNHTTSVAGFLWAVRHHLSLSEQEELKAKLG